MISLSINSWAFMAPARAYLWIESEMQPTAEASKVSHGVKISGFKMTPTPSMQFLQAPNLETDHKSISRGILFMCDRYSTGVELLSTNKQNKDLRL